MNSPDIVVNEPKPVNSKFLRVLATTASYVFHPVFMPTVMTLALYKLAPVSFAGMDMQLLKLWLLRIGISTLFFPLLSVLLMKALGFIQSIQLHTTKDRIIPLISTMIFYFWAEHVAANVPNTPLILRVLLMGAYWGIILMFLVNIFFKISMHTTAAGGMVGILIVLMIISPVNMVVPLFIALAISGIIGTARMLLGAHKIWEIWLGYILGVLVMPAAYLYLR